MQDAAPEGPGPREVLLLQPGNVVPVWSARWCRERSSLSHSFVADKNFAQHHRGAPTIQQKMVKAPDKVINVLAQSEQAETQQRSACKIKAACAICLQPLLEPLLL